MKDSTSSKFLVGLAIAGLSLTLGAGCARTVQFTVTRPAMMNLQPAGNTVTVGAIKPNGYAAAAADVTADLQNRIAHSLNPQIRLLRNGGAVVVDGAVLANAYEQHTETVSETCSRTVDDGTDSNGTPQSHTESYDCSYDIQVGTGVSRIELRVLDGAHERVLFDKTYVQAASVNNPSAADVAELMHRIRDASVDDFAKVLLPYQETVTESFKDCEGDGRCKKGFELVRAGDFPGADALFTQVIGAYATADVPASRAKEIAEAFYDRGVTRAYQQRYAEAEADLARAVALQPKRAKWPQELANVQTMGKERQALREQGAVP